MVCVWSLYLDTFLGSWALSLLRSESVVDLCRTTNHSKPRNRHVVTGRCCKGPQSPVKAALPKKPSRVPALNKRRCTRGYRAGGQRNQDIEAVRRPLQQPGCWRKDRAPTISNPHPTPLSNQNVLQ